MCVIAAFGLLILSALSADVLAQVASLQIGYTDPDRLLQAMPEYRQIYQTLQEESVVDQQAYQDMVQEFQTKLDRYQKQQALLSEERRAEREQELRTLQADIASAEQTVQQKLALREQELLSPLVERMQTAIDTVAEQKGLDLVVRSQTLLFANDKVIDITLDVAQALGLDVTGGDGQTSSND